MERPCIFLAEREERLGKTGDKQAYGYKLLPRTFLFFFFLDRKPDTPKLARKKIWKECEGETVPRKKKL